MGIYKPVYGQFGKYVILSCGKDSGPGKIIQFVYDDRHNQMLQPYSFPLFPYPSPWLILLVN